MHIRRSTETSRPSTQQDVRALTNNRIEIAVAAGLGVAASWLHGYEAYFLSKAPDHWSFVWPMLPYVTCLVAMVLSGTAIPAIVGASVALAFDGLAHYDVFVNPQSSTAALALLFIPLWKIIIVVPAAIILVHVLLRKKTRAPGQCALTLVRADAFRRCALRRSTNR